MRRAPVPWPRLVAGWRHLRTGERQAAAAAAQAIHGGGIGGGRRSFAADPVVEGAAAAAAGDSSDPSCSPEPRLIRNVAIIAHVDHGKTTLMDALLRFCERNGAAAAAATAGGASSSSAPAEQQQQQPQQQDRAMDNLALERERGITILAKTTSLRHRGHVINAVDTPGHADFSGEVERALRLVDGCLLLVDAVEGPMVQTKFVLAKALRRGLRPVVVLSRADRPEATAERCGRTASAAFDLFAQLGATDAQLDFPVLAASGRGGWARRWGGDEAGAGEIALGGTMAPLLDAILDEVPAPVPLVGGGEPGAAQAAPADPRDGPFAFAIAMIERDPYVGRVATGRVVSGRVRVGDRIRALRWAGYSAALKSAADKEGGGGAGGVSAAGGGGDAAAASSSSSSSSSSASYITDNLRVTRLEKRAGVGRVIPLTEASAGDVVLLAGAGDAAGIGDTLAGASAAPSSPATPPLALPLDPGPIDPPTLAMVFSPNDSPFAGRSGKAVTGRALSERLSAEAEASVSLEVRPARRAGGGGGGGGAGQEDEDQAGGAGADAFASASGERYEVRARGELQLGVLLEGMRRDGVEVAVSPPAVVMRRAPGAAAAAAGAATSGGGGGGGGGGENNSSSSSSAEGGWLEPVEEVRAEVPSSMAGSVIDALTARRAELLETEVASFGGGGGGGGVDGGDDGGASVGGGDRTVLVFEAPSRGLIGFRAAFSAMTRGEGVLQRQFARFAPHRGPLQRAARRNAALVASETGKATAYALYDLLPRARGAFFVAPGEEVYAGQVIAESARDGPDMDVNPTRGKKLTNVRTHAADEALPLPPAKPLSLEEALGFCAADELVEVTPERVRVRKAVLDAGARRRAAR